MRELSLETGLLSQTAWTVLERRPASAPVVALVSTCASAKM